MKTPTNIYYPETWDDEKALADQLISKGKIIIDLKYLDTALGKRLVDFLCGIAYLGGGSAKKVKGSDGRFVFRLSLKAKKVI